MIYYIVQIDPDTHNEHIVSTHDNAESAASYLESYRRDAVIHNTTWEYRIDTVMNTQEEIDAANTRIPDKDRVREMTGPEKARMKMILNDAYGKATKPRVYETDSMRDYTLAELFGDETIIPAVGGSNDQAIICRECGALVMIPARHLDFHNKLLP